jgi:ribosomal protein S12 methylthiotransferase accessory factor
MSDGPAPANATALIHAVLRRRRQFGITRIGSITRLDRVGIPVVQVARPLALTNAVTQGKGVDFIDAAVSALMETMETWAAENIPIERATVSSMDTQPAAIGALYAGCAGQEALVDADQLPLSWLEGWDLFTDAAVPVPAAMVDTIYTLPSPHPFIFPRTTSGLAAGATILQAVTHASLELLERDAVAQAHRTPHFFDRFQINASTVREGLSAVILKRIHNAKLIVGIWRVPADHQLPIYWCHLLESDPDNELVPLPAEGFGCDFTHDRALARALLEACQARLAAISGAREDITRQFYPTDIDRGQLAEWRRQLVWPRHSICFPEQADARPTGAAALEKLLQSLGAAGAKAAIVVPLFRDEDEINVVRVVAPPLRHGRHG